MLGCSSVRSLVVLCALVMAVSGCASTHRADDDFLENVDSHGSSALDEGAVAPHDSIPSDWIEHLDAWVARKNEAARDPIAVRIMGRFYTRSMLELPALARSRDGEIERRRAAPRRLVQECYEVLGKGVVDGRTAEELEDMICPLVTHWGGDCQSGDPDWVPALLLEWKVSQLLHARYGGRVFGAKISLSGMYPAEAYAAFYREQEAAHHLAFYDQSLREGFYREFEVNAREVFGVDEASWMAWTPNSFAEDDALAK